MKKRILSLLLAFSLLAGVAVVSLPTGRECFATNPDELQLVKENVSNTGAVISVPVDDAVSVKAVLSDTNLASAKVDGNSVTVTGKQGAVGTVSVTVTASYSDGSEKIGVTDVPIGYTTFCFNGESVTVIEGSDLNYEVVGLSHADELEHELTITSDSLGNAVYTAADGAKLSVAIKKSGGTYVFEGNCSDGSISVKKEAKNNTFLLLNGLTLSSSFTSPITVKKDSKAAVIITALTGTVNTLSDAEFNDNDTYGPTTDGGNGQNQYYAEGAVIKAKTGSTVYVNGGGSLTINANSKNGIKTGAGSMLEISELSLNVTAVKNCLGSENELIIRSGTLRLSSGNDAIKADDDAGLTGTVLITGGDIHINSQDEGIIAADKVVICSGTFDITTSGDAIKAENVDESDGNILIYGGDFTINSVCDGLQAAGGIDIYGGELDITCCEGSTNSSYNKDTDPSAKGIKSGNGTLTIHGGSITVNSADDALHSNSNLSIFGGTLTLASGDDGVHADYTLTLGTENGDDSLIDLTVTDSYEGFEGAYIIGLSGNYEVYSDDDCINAANGDLAGYDFKLRIFGGNFVCHGRIGDGIDSNGELTIAGGTVEVYAPGNANAALDSDGALNLVGGTTLAVGQSEMAQTPNSGVYVLFGSGGGGWWGREMPSKAGVSFTEGDTIAIYNSSNVKIFESTVHYFNSNATSNHVTFSSPQLVSGQTYYLYRNGTSITSATAGGSASTIPTIPETGSSTSPWKPVGAAGELYSRVTEMNAGIPAVIVGTSNSYALSGGATLSGSAVTVAASGNGYTISGVTENTEWYCDAAGHIYCSVDGVDYYLAYTSSGGWNQTYSLSLTTDPSSAPVWNINPSGSYAAISTSISMGGPGGGPGGPGGGPGGSRTLYLTSSGSSFGLSTSYGNVYIYSPETALARLSGTTSYVINIDNGESITEAQILAAAEVIYKSGLNAQEQTLDWSSTLIGMEWSSPLAMEQGNYVLTISVDGTVIGTISVMVISPSSGGTAPTPDVPEPPTPTPTPDPAPTPDPTPTPGFMTGDVDGDGRITTADALLVMRYSLGLIQLTPEQLAAADVNGEGAVNVTDALTLMRMAMGLTA